MGARHQGRTGDYQVSGTPKVPAVGPYFWVVKLLTTAMGEALSDFVVLDVNKYLGVVLGFVVFLLAIRWQFRTPGYRTWPYWTAVSMVAVFGTMAADVMHVVIGLPYLVSALFYAAGLAVTFVAWHRSEGTLDIHSIVTRRREVFYWLAVIFTFAMGTALGDLFATSFHLGYLASAFVFTVAICVPFIAWRLGASPVLTFWVAYILTRPIGASFADFFGMPKDASGMGFGHGAVSAVTLVLVVASFVSLSRSGTDQPEAAPHARPATPAGYRQAGYAPSPHARPQYREPQYREPQYRQPQYRESAYYGDSRQRGRGYREYQQPRDDDSIWDSLYRDPPAGDYRYGESRYGRRRPADPRYGRPRDEGSRTRRPDSRRSRYQDPRYADAGHDDPRYAAGPGYGDPDYGDERDYR